MKTLEQQLIARLANEIGMLRAANIELEMRLSQAVQTISAFEKEMEGKDDGNSKQTGKTAIGTANSTK